MGNLLVPGVQFPQFAPRATAGKWVLNNYAPTTVLLPEAVMLCSPMVVAPMRLSGLAVNVSSPGTVGALVRIGLYRPDGDGLPGALIVDGGTIDGTGSGTLSVAIATPIPISGLVWCAVAAQGAAATPATIRGMADTIVPTVLADPPSSFTTDFPGQAAVTGALPTVFAGGAGGLSAGIVALRGA